METPTLLKAAETTLRGLESMTVDDFAHGGDKVFRDLLRSAIANANKQTPPDELIARIAQDHLGIENLRERKSDRLDFHSIAVWSVKAALRAAWKAGRTSQ